MILLAHLVVIVLVPGGIIFAADVNDNVALCQLLRVARTYKCSVLKLCSLFQHPHGESFIAKLILLLVLQEDRRRRCQDRVVIPVESAAVGTNNL